MKKAQAALEFMLTYGWAIIALIVAIGAIVWMVGDRTTVLPSTCSIDLPLTCIEYKASSDGAIILGIRNSHNELSYVNVSVLCDGNPLEQHDVVLAQRVPQGQPFNGTVRFSCPISGERFTADMTVTYQRADEDSFHVSKGRFRAMVEDA